MNPVYQELVEFIAAGTTPERLVKFKPSEAARKRFADLVHREKTSGITADEKEDLDYYLKLEHIMRLAKARAREHLKQAEAACRRPT